MQLGSASLANRVSAADRTTLDDDDVQARIHEPQRNGRHSVLSRQRIVKTSEHMPTVFIRLSGPDKAVVSHAHPDAILRHGSSDARRFRQWKKSAIAVWIGP